MRDEEITHQPSQKEGGGGSAKGKPVKSISRRDFLKLTAMGLGALTVDPDKLTSQETELGKWQMPIEYKIYNHFLPGDAVDIGRHALILGETRMWDMSWWREGVTDGLKLEDKSAEDSVKNYIKQKLLLGLGVTDSDLKEHLWSLANAKEQGIQFASTDVSYWKTVPEERLAEYEESAKSFKSKAYWSAYASIATNIPTLVKFSNLLEEEIKKDGKMNKTKLGLNFAPTPLSLYVAFKHRDDIARMLSDEKTNQISDLTILNRNLTMAHNTKLVEEYLAQNPEVRKGIGFEEGKKVLFFAGGAHKDVKEIMNMDIEEIKMDIEKSIDEDIDFSVKYLDLLEENPDIGVSEEEVLDLFVFLASSYGFPVASFYDNDDYKFNIAKMDLPDSSRLMLWKSLLQRFEEGSDEVKPQVKKLISRLAKEDMLFFDTSERSVFPEKQAMWERMKRMRKQGEVQEVQLEIEADGTFVKVVESEGVSFVVKISPEGEISV